MGSVIIGYTKRIDIHPLDENYNVELPLECGSIELLVLLNGYSRGTMISTNVITPLHTKITY